MGLFNSLKEATEAQTPMHRADAPQGLFLDAEGRWYHDGDWVRHERLCALLTRSIARDDAGGLIVTTGRDVLAFSAEKAPFAVTTVTGPANAPQWQLSDTSVALIGEAHPLVATESGAFFVTVKEAQFWAECRRPALQWATARLDVSEEGAYALSGNVTQNVALVDAKAIDFASIPDARLWAEID